MIKFKFRRYTNITSKKVENSIGMTLGNDYVVALSNGKVYSMGKDLIELVAKLRGQRATVEKMKRRRRKSYKYIMARSQLMGTYSNLKEKRKRMLGEITDEIARKYDVIYIQKYDHQILKHDNGWITSDIPGSMYDELLRQLRNKMRIDKKRVIEIRDDKRYHTSCIGCGEENGILTILGDKKCKCGMMYDVNVSRYIKKRGEEMYN